MPIEEKRTLTYVPENPNTLVRVKMHQEEVDLCDPSLCYSLEVLGREREDDGGQVRAVILLSKADLTQVHIMIGRMLRLDK